MFHDVRLPDDIERGSAGGPGFHTSILAMRNGHESRNIDWSLERAQYDISYGIQNKVGYQEVLKFFRARRGRAYGFRFKDWADYEIADQLLGTGDGANRDFQIIKQYTDSAGSYDRIITRPVTGTLIVSVDGTPVSGATWVLIAGGIIRFEVANTPTAGQAVRLVEGEFDVPVRFDTDILKAQLEWVNAGALPDIMLVEIRE